MASLEELTALEDIRRLKARYTLLLDAQEWDRLRELFTDDCRFSVGSGDYGRPEDFIDNLRVNLAGDSHVHVASMPLIELTSPTTARALWSFNNRGALGHYQDEYRLDDGGWRVSAMTMTWIHPPSESLLAQRRGQFAPVADLWKALARRFG
jgi:hypothetical protein